jgi:Skp family chaperone for outer membrane proteins
MLSSAWFALTIVFLIGGAVTGAAQQSNVDGGSLQLGTRQSPLLQSPILTVSSERLFSDSEFGRRVLRELEAESAVLAAENRRIEAELVAEELDLTTRRQTTSPGAFRVLAETFDAKVQGIRVAQENKVRAINERREASQVMFLQAAEPVLVHLMKETGAAVIIERSSVLLSADSTDITKIAIDRIDATLGAGLEAQKP